MDQVAEVHRKLLLDALSASEPYPRERFSGRGIVTCAGGPDYFVCAWVMLNMLRKQGCSAPIECWYLGPEEMDEEMTTLLSPLGVRCIDASEVMRRYPVRQPPHRRGWQLKPYSIIHSSFEEVIFIDADNVPIVDPTSFFSSAAYQETGAVFWPDREPLPRGWLDLAPEENMWDACGVSFRNEPSFETGQMLIDKRRCWDALQLTMHFNQYADFYYKFIWGDPETFRFAWFLRNQPYSIVPHPVIDKDGKALFQRDFYGDVAFQHRNGDKWKAMGPNLEIPGFVSEPECLEFLADLVQRIKLRN